MKPPTTTHRTGGTWRVRYLTVLAAAMIMFGSETAAAGRPTPRAEFPIPASTSIPTPASTPIPVPERRPVDDARFSGSQRDTDERITDRADASDSELSMTDPGELIEATPTATETVAPLTSPVVVLYGDSLAWEARHVFEQALADQPVQVVTRTYGGTAICDWFDEMADDAATLQPGLVVIEFVGNNFTPCMQDSAGEPLVGAALVDRYAIDAETAIATFASADTQVVLAGAPISRPATTSLDLHRAPLNAVYEELGRRLDAVRYVDAGSTLLDDGEWTATLPCLPQEPCGRNAESGAAVNVVRAPDGLHFCPASAEADRGVTGDCPVWSSGAFRFGTALAGPVLESVAAMTRSPGEVA